MPLLSLPDECFINVLSFLDRASLYKCLFVSRYFVYILPIIWREPFYNAKHISVLNTLLTCLNDEEISLLVPCAIELENDPTPLFKYGKFVRSIQLILSIRIWI